MSEKQFAADLLRLNEMLREARDQYNKVQRSAADEPGLKPLAFTLSHVGVRLQEAGMWTKEVHEAACGLSPAYAKSFN